MTLYADDNDNNDKNDNNDFFALFRTRVTVVFHRIYRDSHHSISRALVFALFSALIMEKFQDVEKVWQKRTRK